MEKQPAKKIYFFEQGYKDIGIGIKTLFKENINKAKELFSKGLSHGFWPPWRLVRLIFNFAAAISVIVFGTFFSFVMTALFIAFLIVALIIVSPLVIIIWLLDRAYLSWKSVFTACHECKEKSLVPTYICANSSCNLEHTRLIPSSYGILRRRCDCGMSIPTVAFNGRSKLDAICAHCRTKLYDRESKPICIPIIGGRSVGKTAFITAFSRDFIDIVAPSKRWATAFYNPAKLQIFNEIRADYANGSTRMTARPQDKNQTSSVSFSFFVGGKPFRPDRLIHIYDIAGEVFTDNQEGEIQKQYEYCHGLVLLVDPFSIDLIRHKYENELAPEDLGAIGNVQTWEIGDVFLGKLRAVTGLSDRKMMKVPVAVVIGKIDSASLATEFSEEKLNEIINEHPRPKISRADAMDKLCRQFLKENETGAFLNQIELVFKKNRFFACSAIGHTRDAGGYEPKGVMEPMEWLFSQADGKMRRKWRGNNFTADPKSVFKKREFWIRWGPLIEKPIKPIRPAIEAIASGVKNVFGKLKLR